MRTIRLPGGVADIRKDGEDVYVTFTVKDLPIVASKVALIGKELEDGSVKMYTTFESQPDSPSAERHPLPGAGYEFLISNDETASAHDKGLSLKAEKGTDGTYTVEATWYFWVKNQDGTPGQCYKVNFAHTFAEKDIQQKPQAADTADLASVEAEDVIVTVDAVRPSDEAIAEIPVMD